MKDKIKDLLKESIEVKNKLIKNNIEIIEEIAKRIISTLKERKKIIIFGNGGSAADAQHMAAELVGRFEKDRSALPAIALSTNSSILTSLANDYDYSLIFSRQIEALGEAGDIALGISTSGNSKNVINAFQTAKEKGLITIALTGNDGGKLAKICNLSLIVPSKSVPRIQEAHISCIHIFCNLVENNLFKD